MSEAFQQLNQNLRQQVQLYNELLILERHKRLALVENNLQEIEATTTQEEAFIINVNRLEKERLLWAEEIGHELGKQPEDLTLAELADHYPALVEVSRDLDQVVGQLQEIHKTNSQLLQQAMKIVDFTVGLLTHQASNTYTYPGQKESEDNKKRHLMDWRI
ncbi:flagellar protein FlgN [Desulfosporosinus youngiae]|uniref:FlgN protein n=1 Tax=Desulfosporosinus youngiae DSM 17734 TaxID=768710 RepID=H5XYT0_9FIRM|nr:flagellar protein FlgN [Desulfosporosinus youngiae]EHQ91636.1 FlgN protein [Desulfosporosinus youngiae DSM 17734]